MIRRGASLVIPSIRRLGLIDRVWSVLDSAPIPGPYSQP